MRVFLTGATGFFGSHLVNALLGAGHEVTAMVREPARPPPRARLTLLPGDLTDPSRWSPALSGHDALVHGALVWGDWPSELTLADVAASAQLAQAAVDAGVRSLIYASSTAVHRPYQARMDESAALAPVELYAATKLAGEHFLRAIAHGAGATAHALRCAPMVGPRAWPGGAFKADRRLAAMVDAACAGRALPCPDGHVQLVDVREAAALAERLLHAPEGGAWICAEAEPRSWGSIAAQISGEGRAPTVEAQAAWRFDTAKVEALLGRPLTADAGLEAAIDALRAERAGG